MAETPPDVSRLDVHPGRPIARRIRGLLSDLATRRRRRAQDRRDAARLQAQEENDSAVLDRAACQLSVEYVPNYNSTHAANGWASLQDLENAEKRAASFRQWIETQPPGPWREALAKWLGVAELGYRQARDELASGDRRRKNSVALARYDRQAAETRAVLRNLPRPGRMSPL